LGIGHSVIRHFIRASCFRESEMWLRRFLRVAAVLLIASPTLAQEATLGEAPATSSVKGLSGPFAKALEEAIEAGTFFPRLKRNLEKRSPFFRDTRATLNLRTYYFDREFRDSGTQSEAWAIGGSVKYARGWYRDWLSFGAGYFQSEKLVGDEDEGGTRLLGPGQEGIAILGTAYAALKHGEHEAVLFRQELDLPYVNRQDNRMIPNTFEAYKVEGRAPDVPAAGTIRYGAGYVDRIKERDADRFVSMSHAAGVTEVDRGLIQAAASVQPDENLLFGAVNHFIDDTINIFYTEADYLQEVSDDVELRYQAQFTHQQSVGDDLLTGSDFDTFVLGALIAAGYRGAILKAAFSTTDDGERIRSPYGAYPGYVSLMQSDFNLAGMDAWLAGVSFDFEDVGLNGLSLFANYAEGAGVRDASDDTELPDLREFNITGDYRPGKGFLNGFWLRVRWSTREGGSEEDNTDNFRVLVNYSLPVL
jgi:hypothetical protein